MVPLLGQSNTATHSQPQRLAVHMAALSSSSPRCMALATCSSTSRASTWRTPLGTLRTALGLRAPRLRRLLQSTPVQLHHNGALQCLAAADAVTEVSDDPAARIRTLPGWAESVAALQALGCTEKQADVCVQRAFGWGRTSQAYWRRQKVEASPNAAQVQCVLEVLKELGLDDAGVMKVVQSFPEVLGCRETLLQFNAAKLEKEWKLTGDVRAKAILRQPAILGYTIDCMGDCAGECNRCWVRF